MRISQPKSRPPCLPILVLTKGRLLPLTAYSYTLRKTDTFFYLSQDDADDVSFDGVPSSLLFDNVRDLVLDLSQKMPLQIAGDACAASIRVAGVLCDVSLRMHKDGTDTKWVVRGTEHSAENKDFDQRLDFVDPDNPPGFGNSRNETHPSPWWVAMGFDHNAVEFIAHDIMDALERTNEDD